MYKIVWCGYSGGGEGEAIVVVWIAKEAMIEKNLITSALEILKISFETFLRRNYELILHEADLPAIICVVETEANAFHYLRKYSGLINWKFFRYFSTFTP